MKLALFAALAVLALGSCASHNSHRVVVDLAADFDPLVDEAYAQLVQQWPAGEPGGRIGTRVTVEHVAVHWWPLVADPAAPAAPIEQAAMAQRVEQRLWQVMGGAPDPLQPPDYVVEAKLETDLHDPGTILYGITCSLAPVDHLDRPIASGYSHIIRIPRLYCHGCNEALGGHGSNLDSPQTGSGYDVWAGIYIAPHCNSGAGYIKVH